MQSVRVLSSHAARAALQVKSYDGHAILGTGNTGRFQHSGLASLPELGMYHWKARIYSPTLGHFLQNILLAIENLTMDVVRTMAYDVENRLLSVNGGGASLDVAYDPLGRLSETSATGAVTQFLYAGDALVAEYNSAGTLLRRYAHGAGVDEPLVWYEGSTTTGRRWLLGDERGSIIAETDGAGAASIYAYDAYGIPKTDWTCAREQPSLVSVAFDVGCRYDAF